MLAKPDRSQSWEIAVFDPPRFLALRMALDLSGRPFDTSGEPPARYTDSTWGFLLSELPEGRTRLVVSGYWAFRPRWLRPILGVALLEPSHWIMQTRQFSNLQRRVRLWPPPGRARPGPRGESARRVVGLRGVVADGG
jgi:proline iminopeptidase